LISMATLRNLKIKTSTCKRIVKELNSYEKEVEREAAKTTDMKDKGADPYDLKQQVLGLLLDRVVTCNVFQLAMCKVIFLQKEHADDVGSSLNSPRLKIWTTVLLLKSCLAWNLVQENVLAESRMMIPDCHKRLEAALTDLKGTLVELEESDHKEGQEIDEARSTIAGVEQLFQETDV
ncbi:hypothetical protein C3L33_08137, partial [Rhododendron williamsianum]